MVRRMGSRPSAGCFVFSAHCLKAHLKGKETNSVHQHLQAWMKALVVQSSDYDSFLCQKLRPLVSCIPMIIVAIGPIKQHKVMMLA